MEIYRGNKNYYLTIYKIFFAKIDFQNYKIWLLGNINEKWNYSFLHQFVFTPLLEVILRYHGLFSIHSGAISKNDVTYLIMGNSGSGKTLNTLKFVERGYYFYGDDTVLVDMNGYVYPFLKPIHLSIKHRELLTIKVDNLPQKGKRAYQVRDVIPIRQLALGPKKISKIYFLTPFDASTTTIKNLSSNEVFKRIMAYSFIPLGDEYNELQMKIIRYMASLPAYEVKLKKGEFLCEII